MPHARPEMTLREHVVAATRLNRELAEHLEQSLLPKVQDLRRATKLSSSGEESMPSDRTIHAAAAQVLENDDFSVEVYQQLISHCESIRKTVRELTGG